MNSNAPPTPAGHPLDQYRQQMHDVEQELEHRQDVPDDLVSIPLNQSASVSQQPLGLPSTAASLAPHHNHHHESRHYPHADNVRTAGSVDDVTRHSLGEYVARSLHVMPHDGTLQIRIACEIIQSSYARTTRDLELQLAASTHRDTEQRQRLNSLDTRVALLEADAANNTSLRREAERRAERAEAENARLLQTIEGLQQQLAQLHVFRDALSHSSSIAQSNVTVVAPAGQSAIAPTPQQSRGHSRTASQSNRTAHPHHQQHPQPQGSQLHDTHFNGASPAASAAPIQRVLNLSPFKLNSTAATLAALNDNDSATTRAQPASSRPSSTLQVPITAAFGSEHSHERRGPQPQQPLNRTPHRSELNSASAAQVLSEITRSVAKRNSEPSHAVESKRPAVVSQAALSNDSQAIIPDLASAARQLRFDDTDVTNSSLQGGSSRMPHESFHTVTLDDSTNHTPARAHSSKANSEEREQWARTVFRLARAHFTDDLFQQFVAVLNAGGTNKTAGAMRGPSVSEAIGGGDVAVHLHALIEEACLNMNVNNNGPTGLSEADVDHLHVAVDRLLALR